jgi:hypothetical protein
MIKKLNHCEQIEVLDTLIKHFFSPKFDKIKDLNNEMAKMTAESFYNQVLKPKLNLLKETGQKMENGLRLRKKLMGLSNLSNNINLPTLENYYQKHKKKWQKKLPPYY